MGSLPAFGFFTNVSKAYRGVEYSTPAAAPNGSLHHDRADPNPPINLIEHMIVSLGLMVQCNRKPER
jgi:hypothetical protein